MSLPTYEEILARFEEGQRVRLGNNVARLTEELRRFPLYQSIEVSYSGSGDEGSIDQVVCLGVNNEELASTLYYGRNSRDIDEALLNAVEEVIYDSLPAGWGDNDGSAGKATINCATLHIDFAHEWYISTTESDPFAVDLLTDEDRVDYQIVRQGVPISDPVNRTHDFQPTPEGPRICSRCEAIWDPSMPSEVCSGEG